MKNLSLADLISLEIRITEIINELENRPDAKKIFEDKEPIHYLFER